MGLPGPGPPQAAPGRLFYVSLRAQYVSVTFGDARSVWGSNYMSQPRTNEKWTSPSSPLKEQTLLRKELTLFNVLCKVSNQVSITFWQGFCYALARFPTRFPTHLKSVHALRITFRYVSSRLPSILINPARHGKNATLCFTFRCVSSGALAIF